MRIWKWSVLALTAVACLAASNAAEPLVSIYRGAPVKQANLTIGGWGSGTAKESRTEARYGSVSIQVASDGYYCGGRLDFKPEIDLSRAATAPGAVLVIYAKFGASSGSGEVLVPGGGFFQVLQQPGGMPGPGFPGPGAPLIRGGVGQPGVTEGPTAALTTGMRVVLFSGATSVEASDASVEIESAENDWIPVVIPLGAFKGAGGAAPDWASFKLSRMVVAGNAKETFYIGEIAVNRGDTPISNVEAGDNQVVAVNEVVYLTGAASGGPGLVYAWDFDDKDGIQEEAFGRDVTYRYRKAGTFTVTLTVSDPSGVCKPATNKLTVEVTG